MSYQFQLRRGLSTLWESTNPILPSGIQGYETDTRQFKIGNGVDRWNDLPYFTGHAAVSHTELGYLDGVTSGIQSQLGGKQATLVSGTNIKTVNSTSLLGSGDLVIESGTVGRELLTADRTYYVATTGSDSNDGLSSGAPFLTIQKAVDVVSGTLDLGAYNVAIQLADGTYTTSVTLKSVVGSRTVTIQGNSSTPANVVISTTSANCITSSRVSGAWVVKDMKLTTTTSGSCLFVDYNSVVSINNVDFGTCALFHLNLAYGGVVIGSGNYAITGNAMIHAYTFGGTYSVGSITITISNTPAFSLAFAYSNLSGPIRAAVLTFSGSATGKRYIAASNSVIFTNGAGATYLPGNVAGTVETGGLYI
jgi:hypothetical protein